MTLQQPPLTFGATGWRRDTVLTDPSETRLIFILCSVSFQSHEAATAALASSSLVSLCLTVRAEKASLNKACGVIPYQMSEQQSNRINEGPQQRATWTRLFSETLLSQPRNSCFIFKRLQRFRSLNQVASPDGR